MTMFDKLGDLLSEALEKGEIPQNKRAPADKEPGSFFTEESTPPNKKEQFTPRKQIPESVKKAFAFISIPEDALYDEAKKIYREKLMYYHPDRRNDNPVLQKVAKEKTAQLLREWEKVEEWYSGT